MPPRKHPRLRVSKRLEFLEDISIRKVVPSALTLLALWSGTTAFIFALAENWYGAVIAIFGAMVLDMLDGRAARWLGADSMFGTQLDSLADVISFGVAPAVVIYEWSLAQMGAAGWIAALIYCACAAIRLARFNVESARDEGATPSNPYFVGLPTPASAGIMLLPLLLSFEFSDAIVREPMVCLALIAVTSVLMVSRVPTPSLKYTRLGRDGRLALALLITALIPLGIYLPWATLATGLLIYLVTIPFVIRRSYATRRSYAAGIVAASSLTAVADEEDDDED